MLERARYNDENAINDFLFSISDDIAVMNIVEQIQSCKDTTANYFSFLLDKVDSVMALLEDDDYALSDKLIQFKSDLCDRVKKELEDKFGFTIEFMSSVNTEKNLLAIYNCFVMRHTILLENLVSNFIDRDKKSIIEHFSKVKINKKDLSYTNNKKNYEKNDLILLMNVQDILDLINIEDCDDAIDLMFDDKEECLYRLILDFIESGELSFNSDFCEYVKNDIKENRNELIMKIRMSYMK